MPPEPRSASPSDDPLLLPHDRLIGELRNLCAARRSGTMFIITAENHAAQFVLRDGAIVGVTYRLLRGPAALGPMKTFPAGRYRFQTETTVDHAGPELPPTADLLALLISEGGQAVASEARLATVPPASEARPESAPSPPPEAKPAIASEAVRSLIERELAEFLGPIAGLICQEHLARAGSLDSPGDLARLLEAIGAEIGNPVKAAAFKQQVLSKI